MKFALAKEHRDFFQQNGWIEFEQFLSPEHIALFNQGIDQALALRAEADAKKIHMLNANQIFLYGRDLWRMDAGLRKVTTQPRLGEIVSELMVKKPVRLGYDQFFPGRHASTWASASDTQLYTQFMQQSTHLEQISCVSPVLGGAMIGLTNSDQEVPNKEEGVDIFPRASGNVIFIAPQTLFNLKTIENHPEQRYYLIVYTQAQSHYHAQPTDPHGHMLKHMGFVYNDRLKDKLHPIVYR